MYVIMGATGHVGSATARHLLARGEAVVAITRDAAKAEPLRALGADIAEADVRDRDALSAAFQRGSRLFVLNPPAAPDTDTDAVERDTIGHILAALDGCDLERIVAESTFGAQPGEALGDLSTLYELEQGLARQPVPFAVIRAAYYRSNWDASIDTARTDGILPTMYAADFQLPMVAPDDLGRVAADLLSAARFDAGVHYVEGPARYSPADVAHALGIALGRSVEPVVTPRDKWEQTYRELGFSDAAARSYTRMTALTADSDFALPQAPLRGPTTLESYLAAQVARN